MGLVYITILSVVPILAISFSVLKAFGFDEKLEPVLYQFLAPLGDRGAEITDQVMGFVGNVQGSVLAGVGLALLFYTALSMTKKVEDSVNYVWRVSRSRNFVQRFSEYLSIILVGPVIMVTALALIATIENNSIFQGIAGFEPIANTLAEVGNLTPHFLVSLGFTFVYWFIPNTQVKLTSALVGGLTGGFLWATSGVLFTTFVVGATRNVDIYATFAIAIITLMWLYLSWLIVLIGAQVAFYFQNPEYLRIGYRPINVGTRMREHTAISIMLIVAEAFRHDRKIPTTLAVREQLGIPDLVFTPVLTRLVRAKLIKTASNNQLLPARDPASIYLQQILEAIQAPHNSDMFPDGNWPDATLRLAGDVDAALTAALQERRVYDLLDTTKSTDD